MASTTSSPHSSLATPIPLRAPPSPPESVASQTTGSLNPNAGHFVPSSPGPADLSDADAHVPSSPSVHSSPASSVASVSFTLAPSSNSIASFASLASTPSLSHLTPSTTQSSVSTSYHSPLTSPAQSAHVPAKRIDTVVDDTDDESAHENAARSNLRSIRIASPYNTAAQSDIEAIEHNRPLTLTANPTNVDLPSSPQAPPPSKKAGYVPLPEIEIHKAAPASFMTHSVSSSDDIANMDSSQKTPNVYINGLPPNFPEDQLFELAVPFGEVKSVRSFTRHVGEKESGYGFVLFGSVDAAERCIQSLRRFRNLHPTFSKQIHKIPGTTFAQATADAAAEQAQIDDDSFKSRMERLHDPTSTNLYLEGLPLTIDESALSALVAPHRIKSSRFFQTRLSNPPRIIAFVRLDTRAGAEEVIERLHGRMVRGWNDAGSRISVRFADTSEQRELRQRAERSAKDGAEQSPSRLTIAQAALLNLHGREQYRSPPPPVSAAHPVIGTGRAGFERTLGKGPYHDLSSNAADLAYRSNDIVIPSAYDNASAQARQHEPAYVGNQEMNPAVMTLLNALRTSNGGQYGGNVVPKADHGYSQAQLDLLNLDGRGGLPGRQVPVIGGSTNARSGFTPTEEYILQAHPGSDGQRRRSNRMDLPHGQSDFGVGMRGVRTPGGTLAYTSPKMSSPLPAWQEEFQSTLASAQPQGRRQTYGRGTASQHASPDVGSDMYGARAAMSGGPHVRSTTLPHHSTAGSDQPHNRHYQHNSMSMPKTRNVSPEVLRGVQRAHPKTNGSMGGGIDEHGYYGERKYVHEVTGKKDDRRSFDSYPNTTFPQPDRDVYDVEQSSPSLVSPALTYSSRGSGATLSPTTPFMNSFGTHSQTLTADTA